MCHLALEPLEHDEAERSFGRVPLVDAKRYVAALRARKGAPPARIFVFNEDTHALDRPQTEFEQWLNIVAFFKEHVE